MTSKETILNKLRRNVRETYDMPDLSFRKLTFADPVAEYIKQTTTTAGAKLIEAKEGDNLSKLIRQAYPDAKVVSTNVEGITAESLSQAYGREVELRNPDTVETAQQLDGTDVGVLQGGVACAENACLDTADHEGKGGVLHLRVPRHTRKAREYRQQYAPGVPVAGGETLRSARHL